MKFQQLFLEDLSIRKVLFLYEFIFNTSLNMILTDYLLTIII